MTPRSTRRDVPGKALLLRSLLFTTARQGGVSGVLVLILEMRKLRPRLHKRKLGGLASISRWATSLPEMTKLWKAWCRSLAVPAFGPQPLRGRPPCFGVTVTPWLGITAPPSPADIVASPGYVQPQSSWAGWGWIRCKSLAHQSQGTPGCLQSGSPGHLGQQTVGGVLWGAWGIRQVCPSYLTPSSGQDSESESMMAS